MKFRESHKSVNTRRQSLRLTLGSVHHTGITGKLKESIGKRELETRIRERKSEYRMQRGKYSNCDLQIRSDQFSRSVMSNSL